MICKKSQVTLNQYLGGSVSLDDPIHSKARLYLSLCGSTLLDDPIYSKAILNAAPLGSVNLCQTNEPTFELFYRTSGIGEVRIPSANDEYRRPI